MWGKTLVKLKKTLRWKLLIWYVMWKWFAYCLSVSMSSSNKSHIICFKTWFCKIKRCWTDHAGPNVSRNTAFSCPISKERGGESINPEKQKDLQLFGMNLPCVMPRFYKLVLETCCILEQPQHWDHILFLNLIFSFLLVIIILANFPYPLLFKKKEKKSSLVFSPPASAQSWRRWL